MNQNTENVEDLTESVNTLRQETFNNISILNLAPVGTILAWTPKPTQNSNDPVDLPDGWKECDGSLIVGGIWNGQHAPNINGEERFLRGSSKTRGLDIEDDQVKINAKNFTNL